MTATWASQSEVGLLRLDNPKVQLLRKLITNNSPIVGSLILAKPGSYLVFTRTHVKWGAGKARALLTRPPLAMSKVLGKATRDSFDATSWEVRVYTADGEKAKSSGFDVVDMSRLDGIHAAGRAPART